MKTVIVPAPGKIEIRQVETPVINAYQALVKTEMVALCNATDSKLVAGKFPGVDTYPLALGHENAGIVVAVGEKVRNFKMGDRVIGGLISDFGAQGINSGWGGFSEYVVVNDFEVLKEEGLATPEQGCWDSFEIQNAVPSHVQPEEAVISCTWREVLGAFKDFNLTPGKKVIVVGSGPVGLSFVKLGKLFGLGQIDIVDMLPAKLEVARRMGADHGYTPAEISTPECPKEAANKTEKKETDFIETNPSIPQPPYSFGKQSGYRKSRMDEIGWIEKEIRENIDYAILIADHPADKDLFDGYISLMSEACCTSRNALRICGENIPATLVRKRFLSLNREHVLYVRDCISNTVNHIGNIKAYILAALYNAPATMDQYYAAMVSRDMSD